ncbi:MAG: BCAM0308 family protein [Burkholderiales bacterium]|jgi:hypothetical protein
MRPDDVRAWPRYHLDRQIDEVRHDPYRAHGKPAEPAACPVCALVFHAGRWQRLSRPAGAHAHTCPACLRTQEDCPAGLVTLSGGCIASQRETLLGLARKQEALAGAEHPLQRIMAIRSEGGAVVISTTDPHLAQRIGSAIANALGGRLVIDYPTGEYMVRVTWSCPA